MNNVLIHTWQAAVSLRVFVVVFHFLAKYTYVICMGYIRKTQA